MTIENAIAVLGLLGIGGLVSGYCTLMWQRRNAELAEKQKYKESRYKCIILLMHGCLDFDRSCGELQKHGYAIQSIDDLIALLRAEQINAFLYASDDFIRSLGDFLRDHNDTNLVKTALTIRKDLWGVKSRLSQVDVPEIASATIQQQPTRLADQLDGRESSAQSVRNHNQILGPRDPGR